MHPLGGVVLDGAGNMYGTVEYSGIDEVGDGFVYEIPTATTTPVTLASFDGSNGANPMAGVILDAAGDIFGTTTAGGQFNDGTIFEIVNGSGTITTLASFDGADGRSPITSLTADGSGNFYGITTGGDTVACVFSLVPDIDVEGSGSPAVGDNIYLRAAGSSTVDYWVNPPAPFGGIPTGTYSITSSGIDIDGQGGAPTPSPLT